MSSSVTSAVKAMRKKDTQVTIVEVSPRDGLPEVCEELSTTDKIKYINKLSETGLRKIECASFSHPRLLPQGYDAEKLIEGISKKSSVTYVGLVPNEIGCRRAVITQIDEILILLAASDTFNKLNLGRTLKESLNKVLPAILDTAVKNSRSARVYLMTAFGCPYTGKIRAEDVAQLLLKLSYMGASEIVLVDSTGMANPKAVKSTIRTLMDLQLDINLAVHFHNTRGAAIANCVAAYEAGIRIFDTSLGGMSATPYGVSELDIGCWNVPTEDLVHLFEEMGIKTGIDLEKLLDCVLLAEKMAGIPLPGHLLRARQASQIAEIPQHLKRQHIIDQ
ncbi:MAG: hydroxymethylglutaryl-CoA lyase [Syntrophaceae bacterium]|nr:MAG: hydroxymethylglutaryl-CoA lyase [Syntrophaceae bacterium]